MTTVVALPLQSAPAAQRVSLEALRFAPAGSAQDARSVYVLDAAGSPTRVPVEVGVTDGRLAEIRAPRLAPGTTVVIGAAITAKGPRNRASSRP